MDREGIGIELDKWNVPSDKSQLSVDAFRRFFSARCGIRTEEHHLVRRTRTSAAISIHKFCHDEAVEERMPRG